MVDKKILEQKLAELMDIVPECEGLIAADENGKVLIGQTITEMDHGKIAKACATIIKDSNNLGKDIGKGGLKTTTMELDDGFAVLVGSAKNVLIALAGSDGRSSLALLKRNLISISNL
ncbi:MAG: roadblock/LC7 domain-containing protein [Candidatus Hodarchaeota archaeon]